MAQECVRDTNPNVSEYSNILFRAKCDKGHFNVTKMGDWTCGVWLSNVRSRTLVWEKCVVVGGVGFVCVCRLSRVSVRLAVVLCLVVLLVSRSIICMLLYTDLNFAVRLASAV